MSELKKKRVFCDSASCPTRQIGSKCNRLKRKLFFPTYANLHMHVQVANLIVECLFDFGYFRIPLIITDYVSVQLFV